MNACDCLTNDVDDAENQSVLAEEGEEGPILVAGNWLCSRFSNQVVENLRSNGTQVEQEQSISLHVTIHLVCQNLSMQTRHRQGAMQCQIAQNLFFLHKTLC